MWEEEPRWQRANYKTLVYAIGFFSLLAPVMSAFTGDWEITRSYFTAIGIFAAAVCLYAATVWTALRAVILTVAFCKKLLPKGTGNGKARS